MFLKLQEIINSKRFLLLMICGFLLPFFVLSFWNHPSTDDFNIGILDKSLSFSQIQSFYYFHWSGRYTYGALATWAASGGFLYHHYWIFAALFLLLTFFSFLFTIVQVTKYLLQNKCSIVEMTIVAALLLVLELHVIPEIKTQFYWFTSALTYQAPLIFLVLMCGFLIRLFCDKKGTAFNFSIVLILDCLANGFNEMTSFVILVIATILLIMHLYFNASRKLIPLLLYGCNLIFFCVMMFSPGMWHRESGYPARSFLVNTVVGVANFIAVNWTFLKDPLWWFMCIMVALWSVQHQGLYKSKAVQWLQRLSFSKLIALYLLTGLMIFIPIFIGAHGSLPLRAQNVPCFLLALSVLLLVHFKFSSGAYQPFTMQQGNYIQRYRWVLFSVLIFTTTVTAELVQSIISGYFYQGVMQEREARLFNADKRTTIYIDEFDLALKKKMKETFPKKVPVTLDRMIKQKPVLLFVEDYLDQDSIIKYVYGVDNLIINRDSMPKNKQ